MSCLKCLKYTMCVVNFIFFICGAGIFGLGIFLKSTANLSVIAPSIPAVNVVNGLFILGIFITCVSFLGFLGALKENRCLLISFFILLFLVMLAELGVACFLLMYESQIDKTIEGELNKSLEQAINNGSIEWDTVQKTFECCGVKNATDWKDKVPKSCCITESCEEKYNQGCYDKLRNWFDGNLLSTGIGIIVVCSIEVLGMCFSMTLFCHISKSGLGYMK
ncbi:leukocyte surface antigen CD53 [Astyanax mexicanus]|uniref:Tetraspanin n=1 Tax=Astyanax mexicanus TaxID=7994 RepID=A0A8T2KQB3_ASTMX|nr:leukocyte surface antigen CD53 [Astyanax mexicanus]XP_022522002.2 leukocyte surface antigen CD53 [Astyanax mexicanus]KAG9261523.1 leukocyte surface antigen CD53-like [Astyanax mexicanus]